MSPRLFLLCAALACAGCGPGKKTAEQLTPGERLNSLRGQAVQAMLAESTNEVPGIRSIIGSSADTSADGVVKWRGAVQLDYINGVGGVDRTNLHFIFAVAFDGRRLLAVEDSAYYAAQWQAHMAELERQAGTTPSGAPAASADSQ